MRRTLRILRCAAAVLALLVLAPGAEAPAVALAKAKLTVVRTPEAVIVSRDGRIRCGDRCSARYERGTLVTLGVIPERHFMFAGWSRGCIGAVATCRLAVDRGITARAHFERNPALVTVTVGGPGLVVSTPPGIACGAGGRACTATFGDGAKVTFAAHPKPEAMLDSWGDDCMHATGDVCEVTIESRGEISATFRRKVAEPGDQSVFTQVENGAGLQSTPPGIACPPTCGTTFPSGTRVRLSGGSSYSWEGDCVGSGGACVVVSDTSIGIKAIRLPPGPPPGSSTAFVNVTVSGGGVVRGGSIECDSRGRFAGCQAPFRRGSAVVLHAIAHEGYRFAGWGGFCSYRKLKPRCRLQLSTRKTAIAVFKR